MKIGFSVGGAKSNAADNVAAIRLSLKQLRDDGAELATPEEQENSLSAMWMGRAITKSFDSKMNNGPLNTGELQGLLAPTTMRASSAVQHRTRTILQRRLSGHYQASTLGLGTGESLRILETISVGIGNFIGLALKNFNACFMAVELDPPRHPAIGAANLSQRAKHLNIGFPEQPDPFRGIDIAVVGNPLPFGNQSLYDPDFPELRKFSVHNLLRFAKSGTTCCGRRA